MVNSHWDTSCLFHYHISNIKRAVLLSNVHELRKQNPFIISQVNINSVRSKSGSLKELINNNVDILIISETEIDKTFPKAQFCIDGYSISYCLDRNSNCDEILPCVREDIPSKVI